MGGLTLGLPQYRGRLHVLELYARVRRLAALALAALLLLAAVSGREQARPAQALRAGPWFAALAVAVGGWELATAKLACCSPFFAPPQSLIEVYASDYKRLLDSLINSLWLLFNGFALGAAAGFLTGVAIGWSRGLGLLGASGAALPGTGAVDRALCRWRSTSFRPAGRRRCSLIALATWFPVTVLTWSGVAGVNRAYYDVARTMGASEWFLVLRVAIPAALPAGLRGPVHGAGRVVLGVGGR